MKQISLPYTPQARQWLLHSTDARQILYGGAAMGGKSYAIRWDAIMFCLQNPGCQAYLFRRTSGELEDNHILGPQGVVAELEGLGLGGYSWQRRAWEFSNGSRLSFCYCEREADVTRYQGAEMHWVGIDEATHLTEFQISYLRTRNRLGQWKPEVDGKKLPRFVMASNPGGPGHTFLKSIFLDTAPPETIFHDATMRNPKNPEDKGWTSIFIPAKMRDNKYTDPNYEASFGGLPPELAKALREGDWDAVVGQALHTLSRERHQLRTFRPPRHWTRFMSVDWGTAAPFSVGWYAVSDGALLAGRDGWCERFIPTGALVRYAEWYGWNGRPNKGCRLDSRSVARKIIEKEKEREEVMDYRIGDSSMWARHDDRSVAENMTEATDGYFVMRKSEKDRKHNYAEILARLAGDPLYRETGELEEHPMFFATANCTHFWRTVPILVLDDLDPEKGPDTKQEDHVYDDVVYACRSRPYVTTERDRWEVKYGEEMREAMKSNVDPYATA